MGYGDGIGIDEEMFRKLTEYCNQSDNMPDNLRRGELLGFGGRSVMITPGAIVRVKDKSKIGSNVLIGLYGYVTGDVTIGDNTRIGPRCSLVAGNHKFDPATGWFSSRTEEDADDSIVVGKGCWIASNVTITGGVRLGCANLICAGAVVTKSTPDYAIMAGIPAKQIGRIDPVTGEYIWFKDGKERK